MDDVIQTWPGCHTGFARAPQTDERANWTVDRQAELMMTGMSEADALRRAMEDWHTYKVPNAIELTGAASPRPSGTKCSGVE